MNYKLWIRKKWWKKELFLSLKFLNCFLGILLPVQYFRLLWLSLTLWFLFSQRLFFLPVSNSKCAYVSAMKLWSGAVSGLFLPSRVRFSGRFYHWISCNFHTQNQATLFNSSGLLLLFRTGENIFIMLSQAPLSSLFCLKLALAFIKSTLGFTFSKQFRVNAFQTCFCARVLKIRISHGFGYFVIYLLFTNKSG